MHRRTNFDLLGDLGHIAKHLAPKTRPEYRDYIRRRRTFDPELTTQGETLPVRRIEQKLPPRFEQAEQISCHADGIFQTANGSYVENDIVRCLRLYDGITGNTEMVTKSPLRARYGGERNINADNTSVRQYEVGCEMSARRTNFKEPRIRRLLIYFFDDKPIFRRFDQRRS